MFHKKEEETTNLWMNAAFCFFAGAAIGAAVTLLYTPQTGEETRHQIMDKAGQLKDKISDATSSVAEKVSGMTEQASRKISDMRGAAKDGVHELGKELQNA